MADIGAWVLIVEFFFFLFAIPAAVLIVKKLSEETKTSDTVVLVRDCGKVDGRAIGNLVSKKTGKNGRLIITYLPRDMKKPVPITIIAEANKVISYPKGVWSQERNVLEIIPNSAQDYFNNLLTDIEDKSVTNHIIKAQREGINRQAAHLLDMGEGEISDTNLGLMKDFEGKLLKSQIKEESRSRSTSTYPTAEFRA